MSNSHETGKCQHFLSVGGEYLRTHSYTLDLVDSTARRACRYATGILATVLQVVEGVVKAGCSEIGLLFIVPMA